MDNNNNYYVYLHANLSNGKKYVGITSQEPNRRWANGKGYKGQHFNNAIKKYGWDGFSHEILYSGLSETQAKVIEVSLIHFYNSTNPEYGYNISLGGDVVSEETKRKISEAHKGKHNGTNHHFYGKHHTEETKKKMSEAKSGTNHHMYGKHLSEKTKKKLSEAKSGKVHTEETKKKMSEARSGVNNHMYGKTGFKNHSSKSCICISTGLAFGSVREAGRYYNVSNSSIVKCCNGKKKSAGELNGQKLKWKYIRDLKKPPMTEEEKQYLRDITNKFYQH